MIVLFDQKVSCEKESSFHHVKGRARGELGAKDRGTSQGITCIQNESLLNVSYKIPQCGLCFLFKTHFFYSFLSMKIFRDCVASFPSLLKISVRNDIVKVLESIILVAFLSAFLFFPNAGKQHNTNLLKDSPKLSILTLTFES